MNSNKDVIIATIYALQDPVSKDVRYVGRTIKPPKHRYQNHISQAKTQSKRDYCHNWIGKLLREGLLPIMHIIEKTHDINREVYWMNFYRQAGCPLTNLAEGGAIGALGSKRTKEQIANAVNGRIKNSRFNILELDSNLEVVKTWNSYSEVRDYINAKYNLTRTMDSIYSSIARCVKINNKYFILKKNYDKFLRYKNTYILEAHDTLTNNIEYFSSYKEFTIKFGVSNKIITNYKNKSKLYLDRYLIKHNTPIKIR